MKREDYIIIGIMSELEALIYEKKEVMKRYPDEVCDAVSVPWLIDFIERIREEVKG